MVITIQQVFEGDVKSLKPIAEYLRRKGYTDDYLIKHNIQYWGWLFVGVKDPHDFIWLCNQMSNAYKSVNDHCVDNYRFSVPNPFTGRPGRHYREAQADGCCGFYDHKITNPRTGNSFWIGFNYGH